jgi:hypothetical protein
VPLHDVTAEPRARLERRLYVHGVTLAERRERRATQGLLHHVSREAPAAGLDRGQANAVDAHRVAARDRLDLRLDGQPHALPVALDRGDARLVLYEAGEHLTTP